MRKDGTLNKREVKALFKRTAKNHKVWGDFCEFMQANLGEDWDKKLIGYDVMELIEGYAKTHNQIKIVYCDDEVFATSMLVIVPHKNMGNTVLFIPQLTEVNNQFFLYPNHQKMLLKALNELTHPDPYEKYLKKSEQ